MHTHPLRDMGSQLIKIIINLIINLSQILRWDITVVWQIIIGSRMQRNMLDTE